MYETFFNLTTKPFDLQPNPAFLFLSKSHKRAVAYLDYAIRERVGFILLTGEIGSGKTTIIRDLIKKHKENIVLSKVFNTRVDFGQLLTMINEDFGLSCSGGDKSVLLRELNQFLIDQFARGNKGVLIIDEAQNLTPETLEEIRMLSNLETDSAKLLQIILVGQPELRQTLALPELLQLRQRISCYCHIRPLMQEEIEQYILHRLEIAGNRQAFAISHEVMGIIWRYSKGIPRLINIICDFLLLSAFAEEMKEVTPELAREVISDLDFNNQFWGECVPTCEADGGSREDSTKGLLSEIVYRIDALEKRDRLPELKSLQEIIQRVERSDQAVRDYMHKTTLSFQKLMSDIRADRSSAPAEPSPGDGQRGKKRGFLRYLFRAV